jgi:hypothetical protein
MLPQYFLAFNHPGNQHCVGTRLEVFAQVIRIGNILKDLLKDTLPCLVRKENAGNITRSQTMDAKDPKNLSL